MEATMKKFTLLFAVLIATSLFAQDTIAPPEDIQIKLTSISLKEYGDHKEDRTFKAGETVYINIQVAGLLQDAQGNLVFQADIKIPQLSLDRNNIINDSIATKPPIRMFFKIPIGEVQRGGRCNATITIRDVVVKKYTVFNTWFLLTK
jgi:hypothetical protein